VLWLTELENKRQYYPLGQRSKENKNFNPVTESVSVVAGSIIDCNGSEYGMAGEFDMGHSWTFNTDSSFDDFHNHHGTGANACGTMTHYYWYCYTPKAGTVRCEKRSVTIRH